jgi:hypothetical protein
MTALHIADLVVIAGRVRGIGTDAALGQIDMAAAETALAEAQAPLPLTDRPAAAAACTSMVSALLRHPPFPGHRKQMAVAAGLQLLAVNGWQADLDPPEAAIVVECLASGRIAPADAVAWLSARLSPRTDPRISMPRIRIKIRIRESLTRLPLRGPGGAGMSVNGRMVARFSDRAAAAVFLARQEARRLGHDSIDPEHLLLGLIRVEDGGGLAALNSLGISRKRCVSRSRRSSATAPGPRTAPSGPAGRAARRSSTPRCPRHSRTAPPTSAPSTSCSPSSTTTAQLPRRWPGSARPRNASATPSPPFARKPPGTVPCDRRWPRTRQDLIAAAAP